MYAIIEQGGKQYKAYAGAVLTVEKLEMSPGDSLDIKNVLMVCQGEGGEVKFGTPYVKNARVKATVLENGRAKKVIIYKYKSKKGFHKKKGHRQPFTKLKIESVEV